MRYVSLKSGKQSSKIASKNKLDIGKAIATREFVDKCVVQMVQILEIQLLNDLYFPIMMGLNEQAQERVKFSGLYEMYCVDNNDFIDTLLTYGSPH